MSKVDENMLRMVLDMAESKGRVTQMNEEREAENIRLKQLVDKLQAEIEELKLQLQQQQDSGRLTVVVNNFFMLSVLKTRDYVSSLNNDGRQFVGHMLHHTLSDETPRSVIAEVDEMTELERHDGVSNNFSGNIETLNMNVRE